MIAIRLTKKIAFVNYSRFVGFAKTKKVGIGIAYYDWLGITKKKSNGIR